MTRGQSKARGNINRHVLRVRVRGKKVIFRVPYLNVLFSCKYLLIFTVPFLMWPSFNRHLCEHFDAENLIKMHKIISVASI